MFGLFAKFTKAIEKLRQPTYTPSTTVMLPQYLEEYLLEGEETLPVGWGTYTHSSGRIEVKSSEVVNTQLYRTQTRAMSAIVKRDRAKGEMTKR